MHVQTNTKQFFIEQLNLLKSQAFDRGYPQLGQKLQEALDLLCKND